MSNKPLNQITSSDIFDLINFLHDAMTDYESPGRPYDDDELLEINSWYRRCIAWLTEKQQEMNGETKWNQICE